MKLFGTDGIRGKFGSEKMNLQIAKSFGRALVLFCRKRSIKPNILIARDTRESGSALEKVAVHGVVSSGGTAISAGVVPTPALDHLVRAQKAGAGIVVSASHNFWQDNGLKLFKRDGTKFSDKEEVEMEEYIFEKRFRKRKKYSSGRKEILKNAKKYTEFILGKAKNFPSLTVQRGISRNLALVLDCANGATFEVAQKVFEKFFSKLLTLHADPNGRNINDNCGSQYPKELSRKVVAKKSRLGTGF